MKQSACPTSAITTPLELALRALPRPRRPRGCSPVLPGFPEALPQDREHPLMQVRRLIETALLRVERSQR